MSGRCRPRRARLRSLSALTSLTLLGAVLGAGPAAAVHVVASHTDVGAIASVVVGEDGDVRVLAADRDDPHAADPHAADPGSQKLAALRRAELLVINGLALEQKWLDPFLKLAGNRAILVGGRGRFDASSIVTLQHVPKASAEPLEGDLHPDGNPHFTCDPRQGAKIAMGLAERLALIDPEHKAAYRKRAQRFAEDMNALADKWRARFDQLAARQRRVVSYRPSLRYLLDWLGVQELVSLETRPGEPPNEARVGEVLKLMKAQQLSVIAQEAHCPTAISKGLLKAMGSKTGIVVLEGATRFKKGQTYAQHVEHNAAVLYAALSKQAS